jgi:hypothetical protein
MITVPQSMVDQCSPGMKSRNFCEEALLDRKKKRPNLISSARPAGVAPPKASAPVCSCFESPTPRVID